jgi:hypothetical protein
MIEFEQADARMELKRFAKTSGQVEYQASIGVMVLKVREIYQTKSSATV